jgi:hypothetical protein
LTVANRSAFTTRNIRRNSGAELSFDYAATVLIEQAARKIKIAQNRRDFGMQLSAFWTGARADC